MLLKSSMFFPEYALNIFLCDTTDFFNREKTKPHHRFNGICHIYYEMSRGLPRSRGPFWLTYCKTIVFNLYQDFSEVYETIWMRQLEVSSKNRSSLNRFSAADVTELLFWLDNRVYPTLSYRIISFYRCCRVKQTSWIMKQVYFICLCRQIVKKPLFPITKVEYADTL